MTNKIVPLMFILFTGALATLAAAPPWVDRKPADTAETLYFRALAEAERREDAEQSAIHNLHAEAARYMLVSVRASNTETSRTVQHGADGVITERYTGEFKSEIESYTGMLLSGIQTEVYSEQSAGRRWRAWALGSASRRKVEAEMAEYPAKISARYLGLLDSGSLAAVLRNRQSIIQALEDNPLHKAVAYLGTGEEQVNLYDYLAERISALAGSIIFAPIPPQKARKGETVRLPIHVYSPNYSAPGQFEYRVTLSRLNSGEPAHTYTAAAIDTSLLPVGAYRGSVELRLADISPLLRNITREFTLELGLPAPPEKPFSPGVLGGQWSGVIEYAAGGRRYRDSYLIAVYDDGSCWATVAAEDGAAQSASGYWSAEDGVFRLDCAFENPAIARLPALRWLGLYALENSGRRLKMNIRPAPDYSGVVGVTLNRER